jgi:hypothetical protein
MKLSTRKQFGLFEAAILEVPTSLNVRRMLTQIETIHSAPVRPLLPSYTPDATNFFTFGIAFH